MNFLVTGATGNVGGPVARQLHDQGHTVRALVRDPSRAAKLPAGIERVVGDLDDAEAVAKAARDVDAIFLMQVGSGTEQTKTMIGAARPTTRIVLLSSVGARLFPLETNPIGAALAAREEVLRESGLAVTYLRPNTFASNSLWWLDGIRKGKVVDATGEGRTGVIDPEDIARVAVATLTEDGHAGKGYFLTGPEALTAREQVEIIAEVTGRSIEHQDVTPRELGTPEPIERLNELLRAGRAGFVTDDVENITGTAPGTFRAWCERNAHAFG
ncbi:NAD(P)H-binding protein [Kibdelosporangium aridum]|uniref:NAD(P)H-binding protein n=1 Tax=Kibdelosporangium aridum TaxID=2030 RepID=UPI00190E68C1|nr:NAD(P)H-binding protein [Kibdelosporangium aridum]